jgi:hypothetical protein
LYREIKIPGVVPTKIFQNKISYNLPCLSPKGLQTNGVIGEQHRTEDFRQVRQFQPQKSTKLKRKYIRITTVS